MTNHPIIFRDCTSKLVFACQRFDSLVSTDRVPFSNFQTTIEYFFGVAESISVDRNFRRVNQGVYAG